jgi:2-methylisocitrate lyase-like PEP mutase family enzyme
MESNNRPGVHDVAADAATLRALHVPGDPLLLANIWDPPTARVVESAGVRAIATASAALAPVNGFEDHGKLPTAIAFGALRRIADAVALPVTADLEDGYGFSARALAGSLLEAGACGLNLEDTNHVTGTLVSADLQAERIASLRAAGRDFGCELVINARIDVHHAGGSVDEGLRRARQYLDAGADCIYPFLLGDVAAIREYVALGPTNVLCRPGGPSMRALVQAGVARISLGPVLFKLMLKRLRASAEALLRLDDDAIWR